MEAFGASPSFFPRYICLPDEVSCQLSAAWGFGDTDNHFTSDKEERELGKWLASHHSISFHELDQEFAIR